MTGPITPDSETVRAPASSRRSAANWPLRAYDLSLRAFPTRFRGLWGGDMRVTFADRITAARTATGRAPLRLIARELVNVLSAGLRERVHSNYRKPRMLHLRDLRYALRLLARSPGFTLLTVVVLAGGLGLSTFTFSFLFTAMIRPLPLSEGERIVRIDPVVNGRIRPTDAADVGALRTSLSMVRELGAYSGRELVLGRDGVGRVVDAIAAEPALFTIARTPALFGRTLLPSDAAPGAPSVIVLSYRTWEVAFGSDPAILDRDVTINGVNTLVVGVMPERFGFPIASEAWVPLPATTLMDARPGLESVYLVGRLAPGVSHAEATAEASPVMQRLLAARDTSARQANVVASVESLPSVQFGDERLLVFTVLNLLAALILLLALVNVINLLLARANERIRETAVRLALGASMGRLVVQGMWETVILCTMGGVLGTAGAAWGLEAITSWTRANMEGNLAFWWVWRMDRVTLLCAGAFVTVAVVAMGTVVAMRTTRTNVREVLQDGGVRSGGRRVGRLSRGLVTVQVTTVTVLMYFGVMAGVMAQRALTIDPGFDTTRLLQGGIAAPPARYATEEERAALFRDVHARLAEQGELDGVILRRNLAEKQSAAGAFALRDGRQVHATPSAFVVATLGDLSTIGVQVMDGRALTANDDGERAPVAMISRSLAARHWPGRSPVGDQLRLAGVGDTTRWLTIVGVASDLPYGDPLSRDQSADAIYLPLLQSGTSYSSVLVRYHTSEVAARQSLRKALAKVDPLLVPDGVQRYDEVLRKIGLITTSVSRLFAACFAFSLLLALAGTFGLMSRSIGLRTREIGVRRALGATDANITALLLGQGGRQLGIGTLVAAPILIVVAMAFMHFFPISSWIAVTAGVTVSLSVIGLILAATWVPARQVLQVTPRDALWRE